MKEPDLGPEIIDLSILPFFAAFFFFSAFGFAAKYVSA
jgi:hypothetical protein